MSGFITYHTGGGCEALYAERGRYYAYATVEDGASVPVPGEQAQIGFYYAGATDADWAQYCDTCTCEFFMPEWDEERAWAVVDARLAQLADPTLEGALAAEYVEYCVSAGLPLMSADELVYELTDEQERHRAWLSDFILRWDEEVSGKSDE